MRLSVVPPAAESPIAVTLPADLTQTLQTLRLLLPAPGDLLPEDPQIVMRQWPGGSGVDLAEVPQRLQRLLALGLVRRVIIGRERHLCLERGDVKSPTAQEPAAPSSPATPNPAAPNPATPNPATPLPGTSPTEASEEKRRFRAQLLADVETERVLLFRVGIVLELLGLLTLLRHILLWYLAL
jgi:hypothetical protein